MTKATHRRTTGRFATISRRWLEQNRAYGDAWTQWAHPRNNAR